MTPASTYAREAALREAREIERLLEYAVHLAVRNRAPVTAFYAWPLMLNRHSMWQFPAGADA